jgi:hypothetical protein
MVTDRWVIYENDDTKEIVLNPEMLLDEEFDLNDYVKLEGKYIPKDCTVINKETGELEIDFVKLTGEVCDG